MNAPLRDAVEDFLKRCSHGQASKGTTASYRYAIERFLEAAEVSTLGDLRELKDLRKAIRALEAKYRPATTASTVSAMRMFYQALQVDDPTWGNPTVNISMPIPNNTPEWNVLHQGGVPELLGKVTEPRERAVIFALALQGWRVSELCAMTWKNLRQEKERWVCEWRAKGKKLRTQAMQPLVLEALRAAGPKVGPSMPLCQNRDGEAWTRFEIYNLVTKHTKAVFGHAVTPHGLRATYVSSVIARKGIEAARQLAGHSSISTTQRYSRWQVDADDELTLEDL